MAPEHIDKCTLVLYSPQCRTTLAQECSRISGRIGHYATQEEGRNVWFGQDACARGRGVYHGPNSTRPEYQRQDGATGDPGRQTHGPQDGQAIPHHAVSSAGVLRGIAVGRWGEAQEVEIPKRQKALRMHACRLVSPTPHVSPWKGIPHCIPPAQICRFRFWGPPVPLHLIPILKQLHISLTQGRRMAQETRSTAMPTCNGLQSKRAGTAINITGCEFSVV